MQNAGLSRRASSAGRRPRKLSPEERARVRAATAAGVSLRDAGVRFGVSHETVRRVVRESAADDRPPK
ncbi:MAG: helix-turn-helix domain-containing protein [Variibacter sp.]|nr:helix-turn-helix domain-containing protein [Variibacter sp.]